MSSSIQRCSGESQTARASQLPGGEYFWFCMITFQGDLRRSLRLKHGPMSHSINYKIHIRVSQPWHYWHCRGDNSLLWGCPEHCGNVSSIPGLCLLDARSIPSGVTIKCLQAFSDVPWGKVVPSGETLIYIIIKWDLCCPVLFPAFTVSGDIGNL